MDEKSELANFESNVSEAIQRKRIGKLGKCNHLEEYLRLLKLDSLITLYGNCLELPGTEQQIVDSLRIDIPHLVSSEIVRRYLTALPKAENLGGLESFLRQHFPSDPLLDSIDDLHDSLEDAENWFQEEQVFLSKLNELVSTNSQFTSAINRILLAFQPTDIYFSNIIVTVRKEKSKNNGEDPLVSFREEHLVDGIVRRVCTYGSPASGKVFPEEIRANSDFDTAARRAQEYVIATGRASKGSQLIQYAFTDELAYCSELLHEGRSAGLAFAHLACAYHKSEDNRLAPYITWFGSLSGSNVIEPVADIQTKVQVAQENGIRFAVLSEANAAQLGQVDGVQLITYPTGNMGDVLDSVAPVIDALHSEYLGPRELEHWEDFVERSRQQNELTLDKAKRKAKYNPDNYVARSALKLSFDSFLKNSDANYMTIVGESGRGKTYLLCNLCDKSINDGNIVLFFNGESISSDSFLMDSILNLRPDGLEISSEKFIGIVDDTAEWKGRYFMISLDAINEIKEISPKKALEAVERFLKILQRARTERIRVFLTCRDKMWAKLLEAGGFAPSKDEYYGSTRDGAHVPLNLFTADEGREAIDIYFGDKAEDLSEGSREMLRDPFMLRLAKDAYGDSRLPPNIFSWDLFEKYYKEHIPDDAGDHSRLLVSLLAEEMLAQKTDRIHEYRSENEKLNELFDDRAYVELVGNRILAREDEYVQFPHDRFTEIHIARILERQYEGELSQELVIQLLAEARDFPHLWGVLKLVLIKKWDPELIMELVQREDTEVNQFVMATIIAVGREEREKASDVLTRINDLESTETKRLVLDVAYHLQDMDSLRSGVYESDDEVSATATQYIYLTSQEDVSKAIEILRDICQDISLMKMLTLRGRKGLQAALALFLLILPDHFENKKVCSSLSEIAREMIERVLGGKKKAIIKIVFSTAIKLATRIANFAQQEDMDPSFNPVELKHFFKLDIEDRNSLLQLLPYFRCEKTDIEAMTDMIVEMTKRRDVVSGLYVLNTLSAQATIEGQWRKIIPIVRRIYDEGNDYSKCTIAVWILHETMMALHLSGADDDVDEIFEFYETIVESAIDETKGRFSLSEGQYSFPTLFEFYQRKLWLYNTRDTVILGKYVDRAIDHKNEDRDFVSWVLRNLTDVAIMDDFRTVQSDLQRLINEAGDLIVDDVVKALVNLKIHYPEAVEDLLYSLTDVVKEHQIEVKGSKSRSVELISRQMGIACGMLIRHLVRSPEIRNVYAEAWTSAAKCKSFGQWMEQVFMRLTNYLMGREVYKEIPIDD